MKETPSDDQSWGCDFLPLPAKEEVFVIMIDGKLIGWAENSYFIVDRPGATPSLFDISRDP
jgi:hypothetical protein